MLPELLSHLKTEMIIWGLLSRILYFIDNITCPGP